MAVETLFTGGSELAPIVYRDTALTNTKAELSTVACNVTGWNIINVNTSDVYVKLYNLAVADVTIGTSTSVKTLLIPASSTVYLEHDVKKPQFYFNNASTISCVTGLADTNSTAPTTAIYVEIYLDKTP